MSTIFTEDSLPQPPRVKKGEPPWNVALLFPPQGEWTEEAYFALDTNRLVELSDGCLEVLPMPLPWHQWIVRFLHRLLNDFVTGRQLGEAFTAPMPIRLWPGKVRDPDVVFLSHRRLTNYYKTPDGADLVMEIVSAGDDSRERDLQVKRSEYARAGIPEYWIVDAEQTQITILTLDGDHYREHGVFGWDDVAASRLLSGFEVPVKDAFAVPQPANDSQ